jgi:hypothetical protein
MKAGCMQKLVKYVVKHIIQLTIDNGQWTIIGAAFLIVNCQLSIVNCFVNCFSGNSKQPGH